MLQNVYYIWTLIGYTKSCLECKHIQFIRYLNKWYLIRLKYFFKVDLLVKLKWSFQSVQIWEYQEENYFNSVVSVRWKRHMVTKRDVNNSFFIAFILWKLVSLLTYIMTDMYLFVKIFRIETRIQNSKCLNTCVCLTYLKPMQVQTANYRHLWSVVQSITMLKVPGLFK